MNDCFQILGKRASSNDWLNILHSGSANASVQRQNTAVGIPSGPGEKEHFNFLAASVIIFGVMRNVSKSNRLLGTSVIAASTSEGVTDSVENTDEK